MTLIDSLRELLGDARASSFQLMGEDLVRVSGARLRAAAAAYDAELERVPGELRARFEEEQDAVLAEAHAWLRKYNRSVHTRLAGYLALGARCSFEYPWPVVAMLGICQVLTGFTRMRVYGLVAPAASRLGFALLGRGRQSPAGLLERLAEGSDDVMRRTNRGIFADSVPTVLLALHAHALRERGEVPLARALLEGPLPPVLDEESRAIATALFEGLAIRDARARFDALAALTLRHFGREQAIFSHHLGETASATRPESPILRRLTELSSVPAPVVERGRLGRRLVFRPFPLPRGFDIRAHEPRVDLFGRAFVSSVTRDPDDYGEAVRYVVDRFGGHRHRQLGYRVGRVP